MTNFALSKFSYCNPPNYGLWVNLHFFMMRIHKHCFLPMLLVFAMKCCTKMPCPLPHNQYCCLLPPPICLPHLLICTCLISSPIACPPSSVLCWCLLCFFYFHFVIFAICYIYLWLHFGLFVYIFSLSFLFLCHYPFFFKISLPMCFRRITLFCLEKRLSKHKMTIFSKNLGGHGPSGPPLAMPMVRLALYCAYTTTNSFNWVAGWTYPSS